MAGMPYAFKLAIGPASCLLGLLLIVLKIILVIPGNMKSLERQTCVLGLSSWSRLLS